MWKLFKGLYELLALAVAAQAASAADGTASRVQPSDCRPRNADSTCATAVTGATAPVGMTDTPDRLLYDGPLAGVPANGYAYWGFDFAANEIGASSQVRSDEFVNRSAVPVTITLSFNIPTDHPCGNGCLPRVQFEVGPGAMKLDPPFTSQGNTAAFTATLASGESYGWVIGLWQSSNPRLIVTVPKGSSATLQDLGLSPFPALATEIPAVIGTCDCWDGSKATCSDGTRFSNGLLGFWSLGFNTYFRAGAFNNCPLER